jgi:sulfate-transporting ATPase
LVVEGLGVRYGGVVALEGVSLEVHPGEVVGLIGPNGAGKTTLIDAVTGFARYTGTVRIGDVCVDRLSARRRALAGLARSFQSLELFGDLTVRDNLRVACDTGDRWAYLTGVVWPGKDELSAAAYAAVQDLQLEEYLDERPGALPYGARRRLSIARAIAASPSILMLDEPAAGLSGPERAELSQQVSRLVAERGMGVLIIEHDVELVMRTCDRIVVLDYGRPIATGTPEQIATHKQVAEAYLGGAVEQATSHLSARREARR